MLNKFLLITLGGSGEKLARYLKQDVEQRLRRRGWNAELPEAWRLLCVDVAHKSDVITNDVPAKLGRTGKRVGLAEQRLGYADYFDRVTRDPRALPGLVGALPPPDVELPTPFKGAGQRPQIGHVVGLAGLQTLAREIATQINKLNAPGVTEDLTALSHVLDADDDRTAPETTVMIASSLGGGSGAGLLQIVVEMVLNHPATAQYKDSLTTLLFTPDIFADLTDRERAGVQANCLYTTSTMLNGYHWVGAQPDALRRLHAASGVILAPGRRAATTNFFVGRGNTEITFEHQDTVIKATAKAVGRLLVDEKMVRSLEAHLEANRDGAAVTHQFRIVKGAQEPSRPASSLGYASISLGDTLLAEYASERLARAQLDTFLRGHWPQRSANERDDAAVERIAGENLDWFLRTAGLREHDVLEGLYDREQLRREVQTRVKEMQDEIANGDRRREAAGHWQRRISGELEAYELELGQERSGQREAKVAQWRKRLHVELRRATAESIGRFGAPVTIALLQAAHSSVEGASNELRVEREERLRPRAEALVEQARRALRKVKGRGIRNNDSALVEATDARGMSTFLKEDAAYHELAADLLRALPDLVLEPMRACVDKAMHELASSEAKRHSGQVAAWSGPGGVPPRLHPAPNQLLLEPVDGFPGLFEDLIRKTTGGEFENALEGAVEELLTGSWMTAGDDAETEELIESSREWRVGSTAPAEFSLELNALDLYERATAWVRSRPGALSERLKLPLAKWIQGPNRAEEFADALERALSCAEPLLTINPAVHQRVHGTGVEPPKLHVSTIPLAAGNPAQERIASILIDARVAEGEVNQLFDGASPTQLVEISSFLSQPVEPVVVESLFRPIESDWTGRTDASLREQFSAFRRTRSLPLFVPLSPEKARLFISGWVAAGLLGQTTEPVVDWASSPVSVWSPDGWLQFPPHLLGSGAVEKTEVMARLLESLPLALASFASEQYEELTAYMRVIDLGDLTDLLKWVSTSSESEEDQGMEASLVALVSDAGLTAATPEERARQFLAQVGRQRAEAESYLKKRPVNKENVARLPARWEAGELMLEGMEVVYKALSRNLPGEGSTEPDPSPFMP